MIDEHSLALRDLGHQLSDCNRFVPGADESGNPFKPSPRAVATRAE